MTKIKICGLSRIEDIEAVNEAGPDFAGFIINYPKSPRSISPELLAVLTGNLNQKIMPVGVFVDAPSSLVTDLVKKDLIRMIQLHGREDDDYIRLIREKACCPVVKAFHIRTEEDVKTAMKSPADYILLDHGLGENGKQINRELLKGVTREYFLAGGLGIENVREAVQELSPYAVDLNSKLETDGHKDPAKIREAVWTIRTYDN